MYENGEGKNISNQMVILNAGFTGDALRHFTVINFFIHFKWLLSPTRLIHNVVLPVLNIIFTHGDVAY
jgi:hypothetical protein